MIYKITTNSATIKQEPLYTSPIIARLEINTEIEVIDLSKKWATIIYEGNQAYISTMYIKAVEKQEINVATLTTNDELDEVKATVEEVKSVNPSDNDVETTATNDESEEVKAPVEEQEVIHNFDNDIDVTIATSNDKQESVNSPNQDPNEYKIIKGTITIKYIDYDENVEMNPDRVYHDLDLNTYVFGAKAIKGYFNVGAGYEEITLNENEYEKTVTFYYKKRFGSVTVRYIDIVTKKEVEKYKVFKNLVFDEYIYEAKEINGHTVIGEHSKIVSIDDTLTNCEICFEYASSKDN